MLTFECRDAPHHEGQAEGPLLSHRRHSKVSIPSTVVTLQTATIAPWLTVQHIGHFCMTCCPLIVGTLSLFLFMAITFLLVMPAKQVFTTTNTTSTTSTTTT